MHKAAQVAFSGLSGASDLCAALAIAGQKAGVTQTLAFWGTEPVIEARRDRCTRGGVATSVFGKKQGLCDRESQRAITAWARDNRDADAFILHYPAALLAVRRAFRGTSRRPRIVALEHHPNILKRPHEWLLSVMLLWLGDGVVYNTETYRADVAKKIGPLFRRHRTAVITNGIELDRYQAAPAPKRAGEFTIGMSGRMMPVKDYQTLLRALAILRREHPALNAHLELAGDGPMRAELETLARELGIAEAVTFLGLMPFDKLVSQMRSWDLFVLSTHGETQPLALMEAMACGLPCVATEAPGVTEILRDGENGSLITLGDAPQMAAVIRSLAATPETRARLAASALRFAQERFSSAMMWKNFQMFIAQI